MAPPSPVVAATTWEISRRCRDRMFLLRPDRGVTEAILYCVAFSAERHGVLVHALTVMMNHYHEQMTDARGNRPDFVAEKNGLIARCMKHFRGQQGVPLKGAIWEPDKTYSRQSMESEAAIVKSLVYIIANPVAAGLAYKPEAWCGFVSTPEDMLGRTLTLKRPACLPSSYPETATLTFCVPPDFEGVKHSFVSTVRKELDAVCEAHRARMSKAHRHFPGVRKLLRVDPFSSPRSAGKQTAINPKFRGGDAAGIRNGKRKLIEWLRAYRAAFEAFRDGNHRIVWPLGTWYAARYHGACVAT